MVLTNALRRHTTLRQTPIYLSRWVQYLRIIYPIVIIIQSACIYYGGGAHLYWSWKYYWNSSECITNLTNISHTMTYSIIHAWWRHQLETFPRYWPFVRGIHWSPVNSPHKGQWRGALMFSLICAWINGWVNNREAGDLRRHLAHYDVTVMGIVCVTSKCFCWTIPTSEYIKHLGSVCFRGCVYVCVR